MDLKFITLLIVSLLATNAEQFKSATDLERNLLKMYDANLRPSGNGTDGPVLVEANIFLRTLHNFDYINHQFSVGLTLREKWSDPRLSFAHVKDAPDSIVIKDVEKIWRPDTFIQNEMEARRHDVDKPNVLIRLYKNGDVLYSVRLSLVLSCPTYLKDFPFDTQLCLIDIASYAYTEKDIKYTWSEYHPIQIKAGLSQSLPEYEYERPFPSMCSSSTNTGTYSCLRASLEFKRQSSYYMAQVFVPSMLLVSASFLSFFVNRRSVAVRLALILATLMLMTVIGVIATATSRQLHYVNSMDIWIGACVTFIFATLIEFVVVNLLAEKKCCNASRGCSGENDACLLDTQDDEKPPLMKNGQAGQKCRWSSMKCSDKLDCISRLLFPLAFVIFNIIYWTCIA